MCTSGLLRFQIAQLGAAYNTPSCTLNIRLRAYHVVSAALDLYLPPNEVKV